MWQAACVNVWHKASHRKLAKVLHRTSQGKWTDHFSICDVCLLSLHWKNYGVRARWRFREHWFQRRAVSYLLNRSWTFPVPRS